MLGRPHADTLAGSRHAHVKEPRFSADDGLWRVAFAFDPARRCVVLVAADKSRRSQQEAAQSLGVKQPGVAKIERQTDLYLSTLRRFVEAAGGTLELRVTLPGKGVMHLTGVGELDG